MTKLLLYCLAVCLVFFGCSNDKASRLDYTLNSRLGYFEGFNVLDSLDVELKDCEENWNSVIESYMGMMDKKVLFIGERCSLEFLTENSANIKTVSGKVIYIDDLCNTVIYSSKPIYDEFDRYRYFEVICRDFKKIDYKGRITFQMLKNLSDHEVVRVIDIKKKFSVKNAVEYVFFEKKQDSVFLHDYLFECPKNFDADRFMKLLDNDSAMDNTMDN
jgi:hypothetical protein